MGTLDPLVAAWREILRHPVDLLSGTSSRRPFQDFLRALPASTVLMAVKAGGDSVPLVVAVDSALVRALVESMMGAGRPGPAVDRPMGPVEWTLWERLVRDAVAALLGDPSCAPRLTVVLKETDPAAMHAVPNGAWMRVEEALLRFGACEGRILVARPVPPEEAHGSRRTALLDVVISAERDGDVLAPGTILRTGLRAPVPVIVRVDGAPAFQGELGSIRGRKAVRIRGPHPT